MSLHVQPHLAMPGRTAKRHEGRARVAIEAALTTLDGRFHCLILNVSCNGAMVLIAQPPTRGTRLVLKCGPLDEFGAVAWSRNGQCGIEFDEPIAEDLVVEFRRLADEAMLHSSQRKSMRRPGLAARALSAQEAEWAADWSNAAH